MERENCSDIPIMRREVHLMSSDTSPVRFEHGFCPLPKMFCSHSESAVSDRSWSESDEVAEEVSG